MTVYPPLWAFGDRWSAGAGVGGSVGDTTGNGNGNGNGSGVESNRNQDPDADPDSLTPSFGDIYARRYWCLFMLTASSALQTMTWMTYATTTDQIQERYGWSSFQINLLTTWGPAFYVPVSLIVSWYDTRFGVRAGVTLCMTLTCVGSILRILAPPDSSLALPLAHIGSIINAIGAPFTKATPSSLSMIWFPSEERTFSTAIGSIAPYIGIAIGFLLILAVHTGDDLYQLLIIEAIITSIFFILQLFDHFFTSIPPSPPSYSQFLITRRNQADTVSGTATATSGTAPAPATSDTDTDIPISRIERCRYKLGLWIQNTINIASNTSFVLIVCVYGISNGVYTGWSGILYLILKPLNFTQNQAAWLGFGLTTTGIIGACMISPIINFCYPQKHMHNHHHHHHQQQQQQQESITPNPDRPNNYLSYISSTLPVHVHSTILPCNVDDHDLQNEGISSRNGSNDTDSTANFVDTHNESDIERVQRNPVLSNHHVISDFEEPISPPMSSSSSSKCSFCSCLFSRSRSHSHVDPHDHPRPLNRDILLFLFATTSILLLFYTLQANQYYNTHYAILYILILAASMFVCASIPLSYESCVDSLYPGSSTLANAISSSSSHIIQSIFILSQNIFSSYVLNWILTISIIFSFMLVYIWKEKLTRQKLDTTYNNYHHHHHQNEHHHDTTRTSIANTTFTYNTNTPHSSASAGLSTGSE